MEQEKQTEVSKTEKQAAGATQPAEGQRGISRAHVLMIDVVQNWRDLGFSDEEIRDLFEPEEYFPRNKK